VSSRHLLPGSSAPQPPEQAERWIPGTSPWTRPACYCLAAGSTQCFLGALCLTLVAFPCRLTNSTNGCVDEPFAHLHLLRDAADRVARRVHVLDRCYLVRTELRTSSGRLPDPRLFSPQRLCQLWILLSQGLCTSKVIPE